MSRTKMYKVVVYYEDRTKDIREWPDALNLALSDFARFILQPDVNCCEVRLQGRYSYNLVAVFNRGAV